MADTADSKSAAERLVGSTPTSAIEKTYLVRLESSLFTFNEQGGDADEERMFIRIPEPIARALRFREGTELDIRVEDGRMIVSKKRGRKR